MKKLTTILFACSTKLAEEEYYKTAKTSYSNGEIEIAIQNFKGIVDNYPEGERHAEGLFMLGFINANDIKDFDGAKKYYSSLVEKYPEHDLADDANYELQNLGKDINDLPIFQDAEEDSVNDNPAS